MGVSKGKINRPALDAELATSGAGGLGARPLLAGLEPPSGKRRPPADLQARGGL